MLKLGLTYLGDLRKLKKLELPAGQVHQFLQDHHNYADVKVFDLRTCLQTIKLRGRGVGVCGHPKKENNSYFMRSFATGVTSYVKAHKWYFVKHSLGTGILCQYHEIGHLPTPGKL